MGDGLALTVHCSLFTVHCSLFTVHCSPFTVHCSPFTVHRSLFPQQAERHMDFEFSATVKELQARVAAFMEQHVHPNENRYWEEAEENRAKGNAWVPTRIVEELKPKARAQGLWNLWRPKDHGGTLANLEYAPLCEIMGRVTWAPEVFNCSAPDTGNMEVLLRYGTPEQQKHWLAP